MVLELPASLPILLPVATTPFALMGARIRQVREASGQSQTKFAVAIEVEPTTLARWERGENEPRTESLVRIAESGAVTIDWIVRGIGKPPRAKSGKRAAA